MMGLKSFKNFKARLNFFEFLKHFDGIALE